MKRKIMALLLCSCIIVPAAQIHAEEDLQQEYADLLEQFQELEEAFAEFQEHYNQVYGETESIRTDSEAGILGNWEIEIGAVEFCNEIKEDSGYNFKADDGAVYMTVATTITNNSTTSETFLPSYSSSDDVRAYLYIGEYEYKSTYLWLSETELHDTALSPLMSKTGIIVFTIPESMTDESNMKVIFTYGEDSLTFEL